MRVFLILVSVVALFMPVNSEASVPVIDVAAIAELIQEVKQGLEMIQTLDNQYNMLKKYATLDHAGLAGLKFSKFLSDFRGQFETVLNQINGYQNMFAQISRLDEVYFPFQDGWDQEQDSNLKAIKKEVLWTRVQMKHAAKVGAQIRDSIPETEDQIESLLNDSKSAQGMLLNAQIGNQLMGHVGKGLQTMNIQLNEFLQAFSSKHLEENETRGLAIRRLDDAINDFGNYPVSPAAPRLPIQELQ